MNIEKRKSSFWGQCPHCGVWQRFEKRGWVLPDLLQFGFVCCKRLWVAKPYIERPQGVVEVIIVAKSTIIDT